MLAPQTKFKVTHLEVTEHGAFFHSKMIRVGKDVPRLSVEQRVSLCDVGDGARDAVD